MDGEMSGATVGLFLEGDLYSRMEALAEAEGLTQTAQALPYIRQKHAGQYRKPARGSDEKVPYTVHPLIMACQAHALGLRDDTLLAVALLHDVCEDCGVAPGELPFSTEVQEAVALLTRTDKDHAAYYRRMQGNQTAMLVKCLDRCQNLSTMAGSFTPTGMQKYITETETFIIPMLESLKEQRADLSEPLFLVEYQMKALLGTQKAMM